MATRLPGTDVVIVGLGAAGGRRRAPPRRGRARRDRARGGRTPHPARLRPRRAPQQRARVAVLGPEVRQRGADPPPHPVGHGEPGRRPPHDERRRGHHAALLGAELAAQPVGLRGRVGDRPAVRPLAPARGDDGRGLALRVRGAGAVLRPGRARDRRLGTGRQRRRPARRAGQPFEGPRARDYPMPALRWTAYLDGMAEAARSLGWQPFPGPAAINSRAYQGRSGCMYHGFCRPGRVPRRRQNSPAVTTIPRAEATGRLKVVTHAHVRRIETDNRGRVTGVSYLQDREEFFQPARVVLLASYTYENVRLLLLSKSRAWPLGLSNNHAQVRAPLSEPPPGGGGHGALPLRPARLYGLPAQGVAVDDWADDNFDHGGLDFIGGGNLWVYSDRRPITAAGMSTFGRAPAWGSAWKAFIRENADRTNSAYIQKTTLPYESNYLDLDPVVTDPVGDPVIRVTARVQAERAGHRRVPAGQDGAVVPRGGRGRGAARRPRRADGGVHPRLRRDPDGRQSRDQRRRSLRPGRTRRRTSASSAPRSWGRAAPGTPR